MNLNSKTTNKETDIQSPYFSSLLNFISNLQIEKYTHLDIHKSKSWIF